MRLFGGTVFQAEYSKYKGLEVQYALSVLRTAGRPPWLRWNREGKRMKSQR